MTEEQAQVICRNLRREGAQVEAYEAPEGYIYVYGKLDGEVVLIHGWLNAAPRLRQ